MKPIVMVFCIVLSGCAALPQTASNFPVGRSVQSPFLVGGKQVPLPPGKWVVASSTTGSSSQGTPSLGVILVNVAKIAPTILVEIKTNVALTYGAGWAPLKACTRKNLLVPNHAVSGSASDDQCWFINHARLTRTKKTSRLRTDALDFAQSRNIPLPVNVVYVGYRVSDLGDYLTVRYFFNPEADGFSPPKYAAWGSSDWHQDRISAYPEKMAYVSKLKTWGARWLGKVKTGFGGNLPTAPLALTPEKNKPLGSDVGNRLTNLRDLLDRKLITPKEYAAQRKRIMEGI